MMTIKKRMYKRRRHKNINFLLLSNGKKISRTEQNGFFYFLSPKIFGEWKRKRKNI